MKFLSTLSLRRATQQGVENYEIIQRFYPRSPCGERRVLSILLNSEDSFYPRSPCGERRGIVKELDVENCVSIHALLAESDQAAAAVAFLVARFYPRSPCGERRCGGEATAPTHCFYPRSPCGERRTRFGFSATSSMFLSTLSLRRATPRGSIAVKTQRLFLSTLSLRRATLAMAQEYPSLVFLSTLSLRRATYHDRGKDFYASGVSIHALLAESDDITASSFAVQIGFYPRSPCGERQSQVT